MPYIYSNLGTTAGTGADDGAIVTSSDVVLFTLDDEDGTLEAESETVTLRKSDQT